MTSVHVAHSLAALFLFSIEGELLFTLTFIVEYLVVDLMPIRDPAQSSLMKIGWRVILFLNYRTCSGAYFKYSILVKAA